MLAGGLDEDHLSGSMILGFTKVGNSEPECAISDLYIGESYLNQNLRFSAPAE